MDATTAPAAPAQADFRAQLHDVIDQIQDPEVLRAALLLLAPQVAPPAEADAELSPAWQQELRRRLTEYDPAKNIPAAEFMNQLLRASA